MMKRDLIIWRILMKKKWIFWSLFFVFLFFAGSGLTQEKKAEKDALVLGTAPYYYTDKLRQGFVPLARYLSDELGREVQLTITESYEELADKVEKGTIDIGFFSSVLYVQLKQRYPQLKYLATSQLTEGGKKTAYHFSWIIARKGSEITKVKHLRGKSFAFANRHSSAGYIYPKGYFQWLKLAPNDFFEQIVFAGTHEEVTNMVAEGKVDAGTSYDVNIWSAEERYGRVFRRIKKVGPILNPSFAANHKVDSILCQQIVMALENIPPHVLNKDLAYTGFCRLSETNFTLVADLLKTVN